MKKASGFLTAGFFLLIVTAAFAADKLTAPETASPASLEKISTSEDKQGYSILIRGKGKLEYTSSLRENPPAITMDFPNTIRKTKDKYEPKENKYISVIKTEEYEKHGVKATRMIIELKSTFDYRIDPAKDGLAVQFSVPVSEQDLTSEDKKKEPEKPSPASLEEISTTENKRGFSILVGGKGKLEYNTSFADDPPAVTLDFPNTKKKTKDKYEPKANKYVSLIKTEKYEKEGIEHTRMVVSLKSTFDYRVNPMKDGFVLELSVPAPKPASNLPPKRTPPIITDVLIGPEDLLEISVFDLPQFGTTSRVAGDGTVTMPLIGSIEVRGLTKKQVEQKIASALEAKYLNSKANVSVNIKEYKSRQVSVLGAVKNPGPYYVISHRTLLQLLSEAGGLTADASEKCYIFREGAEKIEIDLHDLMVNGNQDLNVEIYPGDVVNFPPITRTTVYVLGAVHSPGVVELNSNMPVTLVAAIARAGGPSENANKTGIQIRRKDEAGQEKILKANLKDILSGKTPDIPLQPGDIINVPESFF